MELEDGCWWRKVPAGDEGDHPLEPAGDEGDHPRVVGLEPVPDPVALTGNANKLPTTKKRVEGRRSMM